MKLKRLLIASLVATMIIGIQPAFAAWQQDPVGWYWQNSDSSRPVNSWQWLDGNGDGISECYYFGSDGYMYSNTVTPDMYVVNSDGAWTIDGVVQTQGTTTSGGNTGSQLVYASTGYWVLDSTGWWWQNSDGTYPMNTWNWLDGNGDGISERYYFGSNGYMYAGSSTPDGYIVDSNGAWTIDGTIQTHSSPV